jgi:hypothetical protein
MVASVRLCRNPPLAAEISFKTASLRFLRRASIDTHRLIANCLEVSERICAMTPSIPSGVKPCAPNDPSPPKLETAVNLCDDSPPKQTLNEGKFNPELLCEPVSIPGDRHQAETSKLPTRPAPRAEDFPLQTPGATKSYLLRGCRAEVLRPHRQRSHDRRNGVEISTMRLVFGKSERGIHTSLLEPGPLKHNVVYFSGLS